MEQIRGDDPPRLADAHEGGTEVALMMETGPEALEEEADDTQQRETHREACAAGPRRDAIESRHPEQSFDIGRNGPLARAQRLGTRPELRRIAEVERTKEEDALARAEAETRA